MSERLTPMESNAIANAVDRLAGALSTVASLCAYRPEIAADIRAAVARRLDPAERDLIRTLHVEIEHQAEEARNVDA